MPPKKLSPEGCGFGALKISSEKTEARSSTPTANDLPTEFFLHVLPDGTEQRFLHEPAVPSLYVTVMDGVETTRTRNRDMWGEWFDDPKKLLMVPPRGAGWTISDHCENFTTWQRKTVRT